MKQNADYFGKARIWTASRDIATVPFGKVHLLTEFADLPVGAFPNFVSVDGCQLYMSFDGAIRVAMRGK